MHLIGPWKERTCPSVGEEKEAPQYSKNMVTSVVQREISELRNGIRRLADLADDDRKKVELENLLTHVDMLDSALNLGGEGNQPASSDVGFDYQGKLQSLKDEFERLNTTYHDLKSEHQEQSQQLHKVEREQNELRSEHNELKMEHQEQSKKLQKVEGKLQKLEHSAVLRQFAINVETELKLAYLRLCSDEAVEHLKFDDEDERKGQFDPYEVASLKLGEAKALARKKADLAALHALKASWFGEGVNGEQNFRDTMVMLKYFSRDGAHPTALDGKPVDAAKAMELVEGMKLNDPNYPKSRQIELQQVALTLVGKLAKIREADEDNKDFLRNLQ